MIDELFEKDVVVLTYPDIDPVALSLGPFHLSDWVVGPLQIHWYGLTYLIGFYLSWCLAVSRARPEVNGWTKDDISDILFYVALGVVLGGRAGYVLFYNFDYFLQDPVWLFKIWTGGMSFHGGMLGVFASFMYFAKKTNRTFFQISDFIAPVIPISLGMGRIGNFIGAELYGRATDVSWAMEFPVRDSLGKIVTYTSARHPSQLYQFALEGVALLALLWWFSSKPRPRMAVSGLFLIAYGVFRCFVEFFRQPDAHLNFVAFGWLTMGQLLSVPMIMIGVGFMWWGYKYNKAPRVV